MSTPARIAFAAGVFVVFGSLAFLMARSTWRDWQGERHAFVNGWFALRAAWAVIVAAVVAIGRPIVILVGG